MTIRIAFVSRRFALQLFSSAEFEDFRLEGARTFLYLARQMARGDTNLPRLYQDWCTKAKIPEGDRVRYEAEV